MDDSGEWVVVAEARRPSDARSAALIWFEEAGFKPNPQPGRGGFGIEGLDDDQIKVDPLFGGTYWRISVRRSALGGAAEPA